jgi:hypothetical protein
MLVKYENIGKFANKSERGLAKKAALQNVFFALSVNKTII